MLTGDPDADPEVVAAIDRAAGLLRELGATVQEVTLPDFALFNACGRVIMTAEGYAIHEHWLRERPLDYGRYTYQRLAPGAGLAAADLVAALRALQELADAVSYLLTGYDALLAANALAPAARFDVFGRDWPPPRAASATQTIVFNVNRASRTVPAGRIHRGRAAARDADRGRRVRRGDAAAGGRRARAAACPHRPAAGAGPALGIRVAQPDSTMASSSRCEIA